MQKKEEVCPVDAGLFGDRRQDLGFFQCRADLIVHAEVARTMREVCRWIGDHRANGCGNSAAASMMQYGALTVLDSRGKAIGNGEAIGQWIVDQSVALNLSGPVILDPGHSRAWLKGLLAAQLASREFAICPINQCGAEVTLKYLAEATDQDLESLVGRLLPLINQVRRRISASGDIYHLNQVMKKRGYIHGDRGYSRVLSPVPV